MLIYAYADILGYRALLKKKTATEIHALLDDAISETHRMLDQYMNSEPVKKQYREGLYDESDYWHLFLNNKMEQLEWLRKEIDESTFQLKTYIAFDTIVIYWDGFSVSETNMMLFLLAIDLLYLILYDKGILIRGAIGTCDDYYIDEEGNERFFIIKNIGTAASIEKNQNAANLLIFGEKLERCFFSMQNQGLTDDYYSRLECFFDERKSRILEKYPDHPRVYLKEGYVDRIESGEEDVSFDDMFEGDLMGINFVCIAICPINNLTFSYLGIDFYERLYSKVKEIHDKGPGNDHVSELQYNTACLLFSRLNSDIYNSTRIMPMLDEGLNTELPVEQPSMLSMWQELKRRVGYKP